MSKPLTRLAAALLTASLCAAATAAQTQPAPTPSPTPQPEWVTVAPRGAGFAVLMSKQPAAVEQRMAGGGMHLEGTRYAAAADERTTYVVWALRNPNGVLWRLLSGTDTTAAGVDADSLYLDHVAELAYELLVAPEFERIEREKTKPHERGIYVGMSYAREFKLGGRLAREYSLILENERGPVYVCADGERVYVVAGLGAAATDPRLKLFADSFAVGTKTPAISSDTAMQVGRMNTEPDARAPLTGGGPAPPTGDTRTTAGVGAGTPPVGVGGGTPPVGNVGGGDAPTDYSRPFKQSEVTQKARITYKPEPGFTEWARRFNVTGVVRLRAILSSAGKVEHISVVKALPHGLTRAALVAVKQVRFEPAQKDGRAVSQYVVFEYNFNIY